MPAAPASPSPSEPTASGINLSDDEYEGLLQAISGDKAAKTAAPKRRRRRQARG